MMYRLIRIVLLVLLAGSSSVGVLAQDKNDALKRSQLQARKLQQEKSALEAKLSTFEQEKAAIAKEKDELAGKVANAQAQTKSLAGKQQQTSMALEALQKEHAALQARHTELEQTLSAITAKQVSTEQGLARMTAQKNQLEVDLQARAKLVLACEDKNMRLYLHGRDLVESCRDRSAVDSVLRLEPFTGLRRVELENTLEEYRDKLDAQRIPVSERLAPL